MKLHAFVLFALIFDAALLAETPPAPQAEQKFSWADPGDPSVAAVRQPGEYAMEYVSNKFIFEVNSVLSAGSPEKGIDVLHLKSMKLPVAAPGKPVVTSAKLTSLQVRDPANAPDAADMAALESVRRDLENGRRPPQYLVQHLEADEGHKEEWRFYKPIATSASCIVCHGRVDSLAPEVKEKLQRLFPDDKATGYEAHEWRGLIRVSLSPAAPAKP